jgi:hypothetical protein
MNRKLNDFGRINRNGSRRGYSRGMGREGGLIDRKFQRLNDMRQDKFRDAMEDNRGRFRANSNGFRDDFRGNIAGYRDQIQKDKSEGNVHEKHAEFRGDDDDRNNFTEKFHERQVDYRKNVHSKTSDDDLHGDRDDLRRDRDSFRTKSANLRDHYRG